jgi:ribosomal protein S7
MARRGKKKKKQSIVSTVFNIMTSRRGRKMPEVMRWNTVQ